MTIGIKQMTSWARALDAARMTVGKEPLFFKEPSDEWKDQMLKAEHSPIRLVEFDIYISDIPSFVATHLVRHHVGCEKFVVTNREDRRKVNPEEINRLTPVDMLMSCNAQSLINISRKRLCNMASEETRRAWQMVKNSISDIDPVMAKNMCRECVYRGFCPEKKPCGYVNTETYKKEREMYVKRADNEAAHESV